MLLPRSRPQLPLCGSCRCSYWLRCVSDPPYCARMSRAGASDGSDPGERMRRAGCDTSRGLRPENVARGQASARAVSGGRLRQAQAPGQHPQLFAALGGIVRRSRRFRTSSTGLRISEADDPVIETDESLTLPVPDSVGALLTRYRLPMLSSTPPASSRGRAWTGGGLASPSRSHNRCPGSRRRRPAAAPAGRACGSRGHP